MCASGGVRRPPASRRGAVASVDRATRTTTRVQTTRARSCASALGVVAARAMAHEDALASAWWRRRELLTTRASGAASPSAADERAAADARARAQASVLATFASWFAGRSGTIHEAVKMVYRPARHWSLEANEDIREGERLVFLPSALMLRCDGENVSEPLRRAIDAVPSEFWSSKLGLALLRERVAGQHSPFAPYVNLLPSVHEGSPTFFAPEAIRELQYAPLVAQINKRARFLASLFAGKGTLTIDDGDGYADERHPERRRVEMTIDANALGWATVSASSRAFRVGESSTPTMLPVIDVCNHSFDPTASVRARADGVELVTTRHLKAGEPIELSYGELSNDDLLLDYGFIVENNPFDTVKLRWDLKLIELAREVGGLATAPIGAMASSSSIPTDASVDSVMNLSLFQKQALARIGLTDGADGELKVRATGDVMDKKALAGLRVLYSTTPAEASRAADAPYGELDAQVVSKDVEIKALRTAMALCALALGNFPTTVEEDLRVVAAASPQVALAVRFRMEKKKILSSAMARLNASIERAQRI